MTVSSEVKRSDFAGNGSTTAFATGFRFLQNSDIKVIQTVDSTGVETVQVEITNYTLTGAGFDAGGTVTMLIAPPTGTTLTIKRDVPLTQGTDYIENDDFPAESHEEALDKLTMITQQIQEEVDRALKLSEAQQSSGLTLPIPVTDRFLQWDVNGDLQNVDILLQGALAVSDFAKTYLDDLTAAATRTTLSAASIASVVAASSATTNTISGLIPSTAADADHDITISTGSARDSGDTKILKLTSAITKQLDAAFTEGNNAGALFSGTIAAATTYHWFIIQKDSDGSIDAGASTSLTASDIPTGFTAFRRVFSFDTDSSANIRSFTAFEAGGGELYVDLTNRVQDLSTTTPSIGGATIVLSVPTGIRVLAIFQSALAETVTDAFIIFTGIHQFNVTPTVTNSDLITSAGSTRASGNFERITDTSGSIRHRSTNNAVLSFSVNIIGWVDFRR